MAHWYIRKAASDDARYRKGQRKKEGREKFDSFFYQPEEANTERKETNFTERRRKNKHNRTRPQTRRHPEMTAGRFCCWDGDKKFTSKKKRETKE